MKTIVTTLTLALLCSPAWAQAPAAPDSAPASAPASAPGSAPPSAGSGDKAIVLTDSGLSVTGLKQRYARDESIELAVRVPRQNVLRARTEVVLMRDDTRGRPIYQDLRDYDRFTHVESLNFSIRLPKAERFGQLALLVRVRGLRNQGEGTNAETFEDALTYRLGFAGGKDAGPVVDAGTRLGGKVYFGFNAAALTPKGAKQVDAWAAALKAEPALSEIRVEGHADKVGGSNYNLELSRRRAEAVRARLIEQGIKGSTIRVVGFGFDRPFLKGATPKDAGADKGVWQNRRAEVVWFRDRPKP